MTAVESRRPEDPEAVPPEQLERLGLRFYIVHNIGTRSPAVAEALAFVRRERERYDVRNLEVKR